MFWVTSFFLKENKASDYQQWLLSAEARTLIANVEAEIGMKYVNTYWTVMGFGEFDCEEWWEIPNWAAIDKLRESKAADKFFLRSWELGFADNSRSFQQRVLRTTRDIKTFSLPEPTEG